MSRIYFHSQHGEAAVSGAERANLGSLSVGFVKMAASVGSFGYRNEEHPISQFVPKKEGYPMRNGILTGDALALEIGVSFGASCVIEFNGVSYSPWVLNLNTALQVGNDVIRLATFIHAQCEIHAYVEGPNRSWMASIIEDGRSCGVYRPCEGWEDVIALLRSRDDEPVVLSYSVCDQFPSREGLNEDRWKALFPENEHDEDRDCWYRLSGEEQWRIALEGLREGDFGVGLELKPDGFDDRHFGEGERRVTWFDLSAEAWRRRFEKPENATV